MLRAAAVAIVLFAIFASTLDRFELPPPDIQWWEWCLMCGAQWGIDFALNIALFIPLGLVLRLARVPPFPALLGIVATTFLIEVLQLVIPGRITSVDDLVANTLGGVLGFILGGHVRTILAPAGRQAVAAVGTAGAGVMVVLWGSLWLFGPAPTEHAFWGQFSPLLGQFGYFGGTVIEARVGDQPLRNGRLPNSDAVRKQLRQDSVTVRAVVRGGRPAYRLAPAVSIFDGEHNEIMVAARSGGRSFTFRVRTRATDFGLRTPSVTVWNAFPPIGSERASMPVTLTGTVHRYAITASAKTDSTCVTRTIHFRPTQGWAYLLPFENLYTGRAPDFTTIWLAILFAPLGYYAAVAVARARGGISRALSVAWVGAISSLALIALPAAHGMDHGTAAEWRGVVIGILGGALLGVVAIAALRSRHPLPPAYN